MHATTVVQEAAERELAKPKRMLEETRLDWQKKLKERRREVGPCFGLVCLLCLFNLSSVFADWQVPAITPGARMCLPAPGASILLLGA
eukprot:1134214-Pelagomonas_calceolata.AAC.1